MLYIIMFLFSSGLKSCHDLCHCSMFMVVMPQGQPRVVFMRREYLPEYYHTKHQGGCFLILFNTHT